MHRVILYGFVKHLEMYISNADRHLRNEVETCLSMTITLAETYERTSSTSRLRPTYSFHVRIATSRASRVIAPLLPAITKVQAEKLSAMQNPSGSSLYTGDNSIAKSQTWPESQSF